MKTKQATVALGGHEFTICECQMQLVINGKDQTFSFSSPITAKFLTNHEVEFWCPKCKLKVASVDKNWAKSQKEEC